MGTVAYANPSFESETTTLVNSFSNAPTLARKMVIDSLIKNLKARGVWSKLDCLWMFAAADENAALKNWKNPGTDDAVNTNSVNFTADTGYVGSAGSTGYIRLNNPTTTAGQWVANSASFCVFNNVTSQMNNEPNVGLEAASNGNFHYPRQTTDVTNTKISAGTGSMAPASTDASGWWQIMRTSSTSQSMYRNGVFLTSVTDASPTRPNDFLCNGRDGGGGIRLATIMASATGTNMTDAQAMDFYIYIHIYLQTVAGIA